MPAVLENLQNAVVIQCNMDKLHPKDGNGVVAGTLLSYTLIILGMSSSYQAIHYIFIFIIVIIYVLDYNSPGNLSTALNLIAPTTSKQLNKKEFGPIVSK